MTTPLRRRPRVSFGFAGGRKALVGSLVASPEDQLADKAKAEREAKEQAVRRSREYTRLIKDYADGDAPYASTISALEAAKAAETDEELRGILDSYISDAKNTKLSRDVNAKVDEYNTGKLSYAQLTTELSSIKTDNELMRAGIQKALDGARKAENQRQLQSLSEDYSQGRIDLGAYVSRVHALRSDPTQKDPAELAKLDAAISAAKQNERELNDMRVYAKWEAGGDPDEALSYYAARIATASDPKDLANLNKFASNIRTIIKREQASGNASVGASLKEMVSRANERIKGYFTDVVAPGVEAAKGDPRAILELYKGYGELIARFAPYTGPEAGYFMEKAQQAVVRGRQTAANEVFKHTKAQYDELKKAYEEAKKDKSLTPRALISRITAMAEVASRLERDGKYGEWTTKEMQELGRGMRTEAWRLANGLADELMKAKDDAESESTKAVSAAYADAQRALKKDRTLGKDSPLSRALRDAGALDDKGNLDQNKFSEWLAESPEENGQLVFDSANTRKKSGEYDKTYDDGRAKYIETIVNTMTSFSQLQKDARTALEQEQLIRFPELRGLKTIVGDEKRDVDFDPDMAMSGAARMRAAAALPVTDSRDGRMGGDDFGTEDAGAPADSPRDAHDGDMSTQQQNTAGPRRDPREQSFDDLTNRLGDQAQGIGGFLRSLFEESVTRDSAAQSAFDPGYAYAADPTFAIGEVQTSDYDGPQFSSVAPAPDLAPEETAPDRPVNPWRWELPAFDEPPVGGSGGGAAGAF